MESQAGVLEEGEHMGHFYSLLMFALFEDVLFFLL